MKEQLTIPHLFFLEEENVVLEIPKQVVYDGLDYVNEIREKNKNNQYGTLYIENEETEENDDTNIIIVWFLNKYDISSRLKNGKEEPGDNEKIKKLMQKHLLEVSVNLSLNENDVNYAVSEKGIHFIKLGNGENRRIYHVDYEVFDTNLKAAMENFADEVKEFTGVDFIETIAPKRVLH